MKTTEPMCRLTGRPARPWRLGMASLLLALCGAPFAPASQAQSPTGDRAAAQAAARACRADVARVCKGIQPGQGRVLACLREHREALSEACRAQIDKP